jgi:hypothetical protein
VSRLWQLPARRRGIIAVLLIAVGTTVTAGYAALAAPPPSPAGQPSVTITFPAEDGVYNAAGWAAGCTPAGICGTAASAGPAITSVAVAIYEDSSGRYWDGSAFASRFPDYLTATGTTSWHYAFSPPANTGYTVYAQASTRFSTSRLVSADFSYDTIPPGAPVIVSHPPGTTTSTSASFVFLDFSGPDLTFSCYLDSAAAAPCSGPTRGEYSPVVQGEQDYSGLSGGMHCFNVYATDEAGNVSQTTQYCWTITVTSAPFAVGGSLTAPLYPGTSEPLDLTFTNPTSSAITIGDGGITGANISFATNAVGCAASNFEVVQGLTVSVTIPADQSTPLSLSSLDVPQADWPVIEMIDTDTNQDACKGASLTLTYSGIEATG